MSSFAPARDGGFPSSLMTVASTTSSPRASRCASSCSTLGMRVRARGRRSCSALLDADGHRGGDRHRCCYVLASGTAAPFLRAAMKTRIDAHAFAHVQGATAAGPELVTAERDEVGALWDVDPSRAGARVEVDERADMVSVLDGRGHGLDRSYLVVGKPDGDQSDAGLYLVEIDR